MKLAKSNRRVVMVGLPYAAARGGHSTLGRQDGNNDDATLVACSLAPLCEGSHSASSRSQPLRGPSAHDEHDRDRCVQDHQRRRVE